MSANTNVDISNKNINTSNKYINTLMKLFDKVGIYLLGLATILLNFSLAFDNVVWGDEAYSQMAIYDTNLYGVFQRVYYWDSHPPLYYYFLKFMADLFGYKTPLYHIASLIPFVVGIILACTLIKKYLGAIPSAFFIIISGLSESCVEYNLEIRMYSLVFMFVLLTVYCSYRIISGQNKTLMFVLMTLFAELAAYTHYFGLAVCGLLVFFTGMFNLIMNKPRKKPCLLWIASTLVYITLYIPWLFVLYFQTQAELGNSWMTEPDSLNLVTQFITGGRNLKPIILTFIIITSIIILIADSGVISFKLTGNKGEFVVGLHKFSTKSWSIELKFMLLLYLTILGLLGFAYGVSYGFHPILAYRYTYTLIPLTLFILMLNVKRLSEYKVLRGINITRGILITTLLLGTLVLSLLDFKYFRSVTKTQDYQTNLILETVGTPNEDAIFVSNGVKHLSWSVLPYYYQGHEVTTENPDKLSREPSEIWAFIGYEFDKDVLKNMKDKGYTYEEFKDMWMGKYGVNLYHFYK